MKETRRRTYATLISVIHVFRLFNEFGLYFKHGLSARNGEHAASPHGDYNDRSKAVRIGAVGGIDYGLCGAVR